MEMLKSILFTLSSFILFLCVSLFIEISSLPSLKDTLTLIFNIPYFWSLFLILTLIIPSPMLVVVYILFTFKKFIFNHSKNIFNSFNRALYILAISYCVVSILSILSFIIDLAFKIEYYFIVRMSNAIPDNGYVHIFALNVIMALLGQSTTFSMAFLITEMILTYKFKVVSMTVRNFILKNYRVILAVVGVSLINVSVMCKIEDEYSKRYLANHYPKSFGVADRLAEGSLITIVLMYLYALLTVHEN
ncbi:uncharacterized protein VICG_00417 [Vittaforma corneae ATCC 50505]|uniref:Uncharacterized protein n=1 Tax=Vittaforma corneae (strain ATCC 50505) TaxID=993615 RepID=L2GQA1_VITCO|nr:uncharacterized protein VICG_00417 [Vittaforma corneae ATCC 50505]ELA42665.1 hypothetical protein VICG_00417 [Vittaforma corneae ATCC 50505]